MWRRRDYYYMRVNDQGTVQMLDELDMRADQVKIREFRGA